MVRTVVILGASHAGLGVAHKLLKSTTLQDFQVILVSPSTHYYWNLASFRAVIPGAIRDEEIYIPIKEGFANYPAERFTLVIGTATAVDTTEQSVTIQGATAADSKTLNYFQLVLATGSRAVDESMPWKSWGSHDAELKRLHDVAENISKAKHIVVGGAGATGVELSAELAHAFAGKDAAQKKTIVLVSSGQEILSGHAMAAATEKELVSMGIDVRKGVAVNVTEPAPSGKTSVVLVNDKTIETDLYLPTTGMRPNSDFLDNGIVNDKGHVIVDKWFRVCNVHNVWALGDVVACPRAAFVHTESQIPQVARNIETVLKEQTPPPVKPMPVDPLVCALGPKRGIGRVGFFRIPSFVVAQVKSKNLLLQRAPKYVDGSRW